MSRALIRCLGEPAMTELAQLLSLLAVPFTVLFCIRCFNRHGIDPVVDDVTSTTVPAP